MTGRPFLPFAVPFGETGGHARRHRFAIPAVLAYIAIVSKMFLEADGTRRKGAVMRRTAYILEDSNAYMDDVRPGASYASFQVISLSTGRHVSPFFATLLEAIEFFDHHDGWEWNGHVEVRYRGKAGMMG